MAQRCVDALCGIQTKNSSNRNILKFWLGVCMFLSVILKSYDLYLISQKCLEKKIEEETIKITLEVIIMRYVQL
jgi:hypothetical protein